MKNLMSVFGCLFWLFITAAAMASETYIPPPEENKPPRVTVQSIYAQKCSKCHGISRPDGATKTADAWKETVGSMRGKDPAWISQEEADKITSFLAGRSLCKAKCTKCHSADRVNTLKTAPQWQTTVDRMQGKDPAWISDADKKLILFYLTDVQLLEL